MRRGIATFGFLSRLVLPASLLALAWSLDLALRPAVVVCPPSLDRPSSTMAVHVVAVDGCLEARSLPCPRYHIGLVNGMPGDLADLKPGAVLSDTDLERCDWRGVD